MMGLLSDSYGSCYLLLNRTEGTTRNEESDKCMSPSEHADVGVKINEKRVAR